ncbi:hypothetical protein HanRHA438_Chr03g0142241 [Helianthus annuus]|nr:hypothetical protein HanIR_Chr03g0142261 [Helianthus annuus]KAJ0937445.1 hypothetical protein HanRHA438_Chr03g0142241 [Helianthus annuus]
MRLQPSQVSRTSQAIYGWFYVVHVSRTPIFCYDSVFRGRDRVITD